MSAFEYATPTVPAGKEEVVIRSVGGSTVSDRAFESVAKLRSMTCTVNVGLPATDGVPLITPVAALRFSP